MSCHIWKFLIKINSICCPVPKFNVIWGLVKTLLQKSKYFLINPCIHMIKWQNQIYQLSLFTLHFSGCAKQIEGKIKHIKNDIVCVKCISSLNIIALIRATFIVDLFSVHKSYLLSRFRCFYHFRKYICKEQNS